MTTMNEERAGFEDWLGVKPCGAAHDLAYEAFKSGAAWQRAQGAVPDVSAMARALSDRAASACCVDPDDNWKIYGQEYIEDVRAMLAAAPAHPAERQDTLCPDCLDTGRQPGVYGPHKCRCNASAVRQEQGEFGDAYQGAREDLAVWKRRALEAEEKLRNAEQSTPAAIEVIGYASPGQVEILRKLPRTGGMKVKGCKDGRYTEPVVLLSAARSSLFAAVIRCEQAGAFKMCMECGYQDGHDPICKLHESNRASPAPAQDVASWIPVTERLPAIRQILSEKCTLEGREIPTLYRSGEVIWYDGKRVSAGIVEWFHGKSPLSGVTHWMPPPAAPSSDKQSGGEV